MKTDADLDIDKNENRKKVRSKSSAMFIYIREILFFFALLLTSYATLFNSLPKVGKPPLAVPFFPPSSIVADYYRGTMGGAFEQASRADVAVVMFYAPWDAKSQQARPVFENVARHLQDEVFFAAISCWAPSSECKSHYPKIRSYPVIVAYPHQGAGIEYKGPLTTGHIIKFVEAILRPIKRVHSPNDLVHLFSIYDAVVVGSFLFEGSLGGRGYYTFFMSALKSLDKDFHHEIAYAVTTTAEDAAALNVEEVPSIKLFLWNETHEFPLDAEYTEDSVSSWVWQKTQRVPKWLSLPGTKATTLLPYLSTGPALIVFTPRHPLLSTTPVFSIMKELSLNYYNCDNSTNAWVTALANNLELVNRGLQSKHQRSELKCSWLRQEKNVLRRKAERITSTVIAANVWTNYSGCDMCKMGSMLGPQLEVCVKPSSLPANLTSKTIRYETSMFNNENDDFGPQALLSEKERHECRLLEASHSEKNIYFPKLKPGVSKSISGQACANNRTLSIIALDSILHYQLAEGVGVDVLNMPQKTAAIIIDPLSESQFLLKETLTQASLAQFIQNHTDKTLVRHHRSTENDRRSLARGRYSVKDERSCVNSDTEVCVSELHSGNFLSTIMDPSKAVVVLFHSPFCSLCRSISHAFLLLSRYFRHFPSLRFVRIDGENNDLPWRYNMGSYPTIIFFPTLKKDESRVFNESQAITVRNLMHFVLANLEPEAKIAAMFSLCISYEKLQSPEEARACKRKIEIQVQEGLSSSLGRMRSVMGRWYEVTPRSSAASSLHRQKSELISSLQFFRGAGFILGAIDRASSGLVDIIELYLKFLKPR